jgi:hypothetical protein
MRNVRCYRVVDGQMVYRSSSMQLAANDGGPVVAGFWSRRRLLRALRSVVAFVLASGCASPAVLRGAVNPPAGQAEAETALEGNVDVIIEDSDQGTRTLYFLILGDRRVPLRFADKPPNLTSGTRVRVRGRWDADTLVVTAIERL